MSEDGRAVTPDEIEASCAFLQEAARYFRNRPTRGEDLNHWANVYNAENCEKAIARFKALIAIVAAEGS